METIKKYFETIISPKKIFKNRAYLTTFQKVLLVIFFLLLLNVPLLLSISMTDSIDFYSVVPEVKELVQDEKVLEAVQALETEDKHFVIGEKTTITEDANGQVIALPAAESLDWTQDDGVIFAIKESTIEIYDSYLEPEDNPSVDFALTDVASLQEATTVEEFSEELVDQWKQGEEKTTKRALMFNLVNIVSMLFLFIFIIFTMIVFLFKFFKGFTIASYAEAFTIALNAFGLPTLIVFFIGLFLPTPLLTLPLQLLMSLVMIVASFIQTRFNDEELAE